MSAAYETPVALNPDYEMPVAAHSPHSLVAAAATGSNPGLARNDGIAIEHLTKVLRIECLVSLAGKLNRFAQIGRPDLDVDDKPRPPWRDPLVNPQDATIWHMVHGRVMG